MVIHIEFDIKITDHNGIVIQSTGTHFDKNVASDGKLATDDVLDIDFTDFLAEYLSTSGYFLREKLMKGRSSRRRKGHVGSKANKEDVKVIEPDDEGIPDLLKGSELEYKIRIGNNKVLIGKIPLKLEDNSNPEMDNSIISATLVAEELTIERDTDSVEDANRYEPSNNDMDVNSSQSYNSDVTIDSLESSNSDKDISSLDPYYSDEDIDSIASFDSDEELDCLESSDSDVELDCFESSDSDVELDYFESSDIDVEPDRFKSSISDRDPAVYNFSMMRAIEKYEDNIYNVWYEPSSDMEPAIDE